jgi:hypothetical protein
MALGYVRTAAGAHGWPPMRWRAKLAESPGTAPARGKNSMTINIFMVTRVVFRTPACHNDDRLLDMARPRWG